MIKASPLPDQAPAPEEPRRSTRQDGRNNEQAVLRAPRDRGRQVRVLRTSGPDSSAGWTHRTRDKHGLSSSQGRGSSRTTTQLHSLKLGSGGMRPKDRSTHPATLYYAPKSYARTRRSPNPAATFPARSHDADGATNAATTRTPPRYDHRPRAGAPRGATRSEAGRDAGPTNVPTTPWPGASRGRSTWRMDKPYRIPSARRS